MDIQTETVRNVHSQTLKKHVEVLESYTNTLREAAANDTYTTPESALRVPFDTNLLTEAKEVAQRYTEAKKVFLIGIGGSDMGTRAVYDALRGYHEDTDSKPKLYDLSTLEPKQMQRIQRIIEETEHSDEIVCIVISKSGTTTETMANANILFHLFEQKFGTLKAVQQTIVISNEDSILTDNAKTKGITVAHIPTPVGGRYSVFTHVGLIPLAILGFDIDAFCEGAQKGVQTSIQEHGPRTGAVLASLLYEAYTTGARVHELFFWNPELETVGKWYRQLLAESIGKKRDYDNKKVGLSPSIAIGSTDLHSLGQLIFGGRNDRFTTFVSARSEWHHENAFTNNSPFMLKILEEKNMEHVLQAIYEGVRNTYKLHELNYLSIELSEISERELGVFMSLQMTVIMYLAQLLNVNAFDQPAVETYKKETRDLLTK